VNATVVWLTGLPSSGKTTLARAVKHRLDLRNVPCCLLDSDEVRDALNPRPGYDSVGRAAFYATLAALAALLSRQGLVALVSATAHQKAYRESARAAAPRFMEVYVDTPLEECQRRDTKGLYGRAHNGQITDVPGVHVLYEAPTRPAVVAHGGEDNKAADEIVAAILLGDPGSAGEE
jgi:adenylylsulfate kinase